MSKSHFDLDTPPPEPLAEDTDTPETPIVSKPIKQKLITLPLGIKVTPIQAGIMALSLIGIVMFGVMRNNPHDSGAPPQFAAQETVSPSVPTPVTSSPAGSITREQQTPATMPMPEPTEHAIVTEATQHAIENNRVFSENNREGIKALDERIRALEREVNALAQRPSTTIATPQPTAAVRSANHGHRTGTKPHSLRGATIASLYPGLAWVNYQGSTWALRPGDRIGNATVQSIDTTQRQVITTAGVIR
jgi:intracellular multiplication protein IcmG